MANLICESDRSSRHSSQTSLACKNPIDMTPYHVAKQADEYLKTQISALTSPKSLLCEIIYKTLGNGDRKLTIDTAEIAISLCRHVSAALQDELDYKPYNLLKEFKSAVLEITLDDPGPYISELRRSLRLEGWSQIATRLMSTAISEHMHPLIELTAELVDTASQHKLARERYPLPCQIEVEMSKRVSGILANCRRSIYISLAPQITDIVCAEFEMLRLYRMPSVAL